MGWGGSEHDYPFTEFGGTDSHIKFFGAHIKLQFDASVDLTVEYRCENIDNVIAKGEVRVGIKKEPAACRFMAGDRRGLNREVIDPYLIKDLLFCVLNRFAGGKAALRADATMEVFNFGKVVFEVCRFVEDMGRMANTVDRVVGHVRLDGCHIINLKDKAKELA